MNTFNINKNYKKRKPQPKKSGENTRKTIKENKSAPHTDKKPIWLSTKNKDVSLPKSDTASQN